MLKSFRFKNFKSFKEAELPLAPLTVLIGANASGKSNAIEGIQLLSWLAEGQSLDDIYAAIRDEELQLRGSLPQLLNVDSTTDEFELSCTTDPSEDVDFISFIIRVERDSGSLQLTERIPDIIELGIADDSNTDTNLTKGGRTKKLSRLQRLVTRSMLLWGRTDRIFFLNPAPRLMRSYTFHRDNELRPDGSNLSASVYRLNERHENKQRLLSFIQSLPEQDIQDIEFIETSRGDVMVQLVESLGGKRNKVDAGSLSDGTLRVLAIAAALLSVPEGTLVVIEEIDNGVHPSRADELLAQIQKVIKERNLQVLVTTHNPALLDALPPEVVHDTVACYRDPEDGSSRLARLRDLDGYAEVVARGPLGHVVTKGILDKVLKDRETPEEKLKKKLEWLDSLPKVTAG